MAAAGGFGGRGGAMCPHCSYLLPNHADWCPMATPQRSSNERRPETPSTSPRYSGYSQEYSYSDDLPVDAEAVTPLLPPPVPRVRLPSWMSARPEQSVFEESDESAAASDSAWAGMPGAPRPRVQPIRIGRPTSTGRARRTLSLPSAAAESAPSSPQRSNKRKGDKTPRQSPKRRRKRGGKRHSRKKRTRRRRRTKRRKRSRKKRTKKRRR